VKRYRAGLSIVRQTSASTFSEYSDEISFQSRLFSRITCLAFTTIQRCKSSVKKYSATTGIVQALFRR